MTAKTNELIDALRMSIKENEQLRKQNRQLLTRSAEPLAIVGMSCRFGGGATSPEGLWQLLAEGRDAMVPLPEDRGWQVDRLYHPDPDHPGTTYARTGGFVDGVAEFDAGFFGIGPREALAMDPQQRLILEGAWEAFENAGIDPTSLRGSDTGVFCGAISSEYGATMPPELGGYRLGILTSVLAGRISYLLGLEGPAVTVDTACSSSLVALHQAAQALRAGECSMALVGGVTVLSSPTLLVEFSRQRGLAPDGRCKAYSQDADGTGFADGCGLIVLERLSDARRRGHTVLAVVRGSAVNQDGASNGLTAPSGPAQARVIRAALASSGLSAADVDAVEGHGTGTELGDPIEAHALLDTYGRERVNGPLWLGSVKSNIGHTSAAAGIAGVIKMVLAMRHEMLPATLYADTPSTNVDWDRGQVAVLSQPRPWRPAEGRPRRAGVSSFGVSGTNVHVILEEAPPAPAAPGATPEPDPDRPRRPAGVVPVLVSGRTEAALRAQAERLRDHLARRPELTPLDIGYSTATTRALLERRAVVTAADRDGLMAALADLAAGEPGAVTGGAVAGKTAVLFTGQGSQRARMGAGLAAVYPAFSAALDEVCAVVDPLLGRPVRELLSAEPGSDAAALLDATEYTQVALFAVEVALYRLVESFGVRPDYLIGHSVGEIAAAHVAGVLSLEDAAALVVARGRLMGALPAGGAMVAVQATEDEVAATLDGYRGRLEIAAVNGPRAVVVSGDADAAEEWLPRFADRKTSRLKVSHAFHSPRMEPMLAEFASVARTLRFSAPKIAIVSNVTGEKVTDEITDPMYWVKHVRQAVRFADGVRTLYRLGARRFLELGPDAVLTAMAGQTLDDADAGDAVLVPALRARQDEAETFARFLGAARIAGAEVDWAAYYAGTPAARVELPTYAFQRERFWLAPGTGSADAAAAGQVGLDHAVLTAAVPVADRDEWVFTGRVAAGTQPWIAEHVVHGALVLPGAALVDVALTAGAAVGCPALEELEITTQVVLTDEPRQVQVTVGAADADGRREIALYTRATATAGEPPEAVCHARGRLGATPAPPVPFEAEWPPAGAEPVPVDDLYARLAEAGVDHGPLFQGVQAAWRRGAEVYTEVALPDDIDGTGYGLHPALFDAALHGGLLDTEPGAAPQLPVSWADVSFGPATAARLRVRITAADSVLRVDAVDLDGEPVLSAGRVGHRPAPHLGGALRHGTDALFEPVWTAVDAQPSPAARIAVLGELEATGERFADLDALESAVAGGAQAPTLVLAPVPEPEADGGPGVRELCGRVAEAVRRWVASPLSADARLVLVTRGAVAAGGLVPDPAPAAVWGAVRVAQSEHPDTVVLVDLDDRAAVDWTVLGELDEPELAVREGTLLAPRLTPAPAAGAGPAWDPAGTVLITCGPGGAGPAVARELARRHTGPLLLAALGGPDRAAEAVAADLAGTGARAVVCDTTDALADVLASVDGPLTAVVHAPGPAADGTLRTHTGDQLDRAVGAKLDVALRLRELTAGQDLAAFAVICSDAGLHGTAGRVADAAADAALEAVVHRLRAEGVPATALVWGAWVDATEEPELVRQLVHRIGAAPALLTPVREDAAELRARARRGTLAARLRGLVRTPARRDRAGGSLARTLATTPEADRVRVVLDLVRAQVAAVLGHASHTAIDPERPFKDVGLDSMGAVELRNRLTRVSGLRLSATTVFDHPTPAAIARLIVGELAGTGDTARPAVPARRRPVDEPLAIVGMSCRYPGGINSPDELWEFVAAGRDGMTGFPADRGWNTDELYHPDPEHPGTTYARIGGFIEGAGDFDAGFFGIGPHEARAMDPQQRWLLEGAWEAFEHAGIDPTSLRGTDTGVYCGAVNPDYGTAVPPELEQFHMTGVMSSVLSGRIAYTLGLEGPAITVDTACSASLVALHLAMQALRAGECSLALAGGVTVMSTPVALTDTARIHGLSPDGRCKAFSAAADGTSFSDGMGLLVLERLSDARRNGHRVLAVLRGSAINQDGATNGLTAPNGPSQERVIRAALAASGLRPAQVDVVEAHGTGTKLGDPIEAHALLATYGQDRDRGPLRLGSVKSNIGHAGPAAGVAGVIKMVQAMRHELLPRTLHVDEPSPHIDWDAGEVELLLEDQPWKTDGRPRRAGISAFGMSGTNAHVILEEAPAADPAPRTDGRPLPAVPVLLSARTRAALRAQADRLHAHLLANPGLDPLDVGFSTATTRAALPRRAAVAARDRAELLDGLAALAGDTPAEHTVDGKALDGRTVFVFPGHGSHWTGMAVRLLDTAPVFADEIAACGRAFAPYVDWDLEEVLRGAPGAPSLDASDGAVAMDVLQPAMFSVLVSLAALWRAHGVEPDVVVGHSQGEVAAAYVAGALSLQDAALIVAMRNRLAQDRLPEGTGLLWLGTSRDEAERRAAAHAGRASVAVVNSPVSVVLAGDTGVLDQVRAECERDGLRTRPLGAFASHSAAVEVIETELVESLAPVAPRAGRIPFYSTAVDGYVETAGLDAAYWYKNIRNEVGFEAAVRALIDDGATRFVEMSPHPVLTTAIEQTAAAHETGGRAATVATLGTLRRDEGGLDRFALSLAEAHTAGVTVDWDGFYAGTGATRVSLPTYAFQRKRYWLAPAAAVPGGPATAPSDEHPHEDADDEGGALVRRLAAVPADEREALAQQVVRDQIAAVLGHESGDAVEPDQGFWEMGFNSVGVVRLGNRLRRVTGVQVASTVIFQHPDAISLGRWLVRHLADEVAAAGTDPAPGDAGARRPGPATAGDGPVPEAPAPRGATATATAAPPAAGPAPDGCGTFTSLIRHAHAVGELDRAMSWLMESSRFRPAFTSPADLPENTAQVVRLTRGDAGRPAVVCVPSFAVGSGPHLFLALAGRLPGRDVYSCSLPGFRDGEPLPGSWDTAVRVLADRVEQAVGDAEVVLVGYSIGGAVAHSLAAELEGRGRAAAGLVLLDPPDPRSVVAHDGGVFEPSMDALLNGGRDLAFDDSGWLAMGAYLRLLGERADTGVGAPRLCLRAGDTRSWPAWDVGGDVVDLDTGHFDLVNDPECAETVEKWIRCGFSADSGLYDKENR
ncbi:type I polyketide synthase [Streptomyces pactum]|uniref:Polyketide synthase n=2 Tax=Streptomyces pactum TaxID=68249 RepID=A0A7T2D920_9ACTN|nr:type I polyketide synthase [Streptomyces pactum]QPP46750.1 polyketide synthase [Streptomyces pactum]